MSSITSSASPSRESRATNRGHVARVGLAATLAATLGNALVYFLGSALVAYDPQFLPLANVSGAIVFTLPAALVAAGIYALLLRFANRPARTFTVIAAVVFVMTLIPDFTYLPTVAGATGGQIAVLVMMHVVAAGIITAMLTRLTGPQSR